MHRFLLVIPLIVIALAGPWHMMRTGDGVSASFEAPAILVAGIVSRVLLQRFVRPLASKQDSIGGWALEFSFASILGIIAAIEDWYPGPRVQSEEEFGAVFLYVLGMPIYILGWWVAGRMKRQHPAATLVARRP